MHIYSGVDSRGELRKHRANDARSESVSQRLSLKIHWAAVIPVLRYYGKNLGWRRGAAIRLVLIGRDSLEAAKATLFRSEPKLVDALRSDEKVKVSFAELPGAFATVGMADSARHLQ